MCSITIIPQNKIRFNYVSNSDLIAIVMSIAIFSIGNPIYTWRFTKEILSAPEWKEYQIL